VERARAHTTTDNAEPLLMMYRKTGAAAVALDARCGEWVANERESESGRKGHSWGIPQMKGNKGIQAVKGNRDHARRRTLRGGLDGEGGWAQCGWC